MIKFILYEIHMLGCFKLRDWPFTYTCKEGTNTQHTKTDTETMQAQLAEKPGNMKLNKGHNQ